VWVIHGLFFSLSEVLVKNNGVSFGYSGWLVSLLNIGALVYLFWFWWRSNYVGINFVLIGGGVNMIDRMFLGYVRDYWWFGPVYNNIADWLIGIGVIVFLWEIWRKK